jgi:aminopeptidase N
MRRTVALFALLVASTVLAPVGAQERISRRIPAPAAKDSDVLRTAGDRPLAVRNLRLNLKVDLPAKTVDGRATMDFRTRRRLGSVRLDAVGFEVKQVGLALGKKDYPKVKHSHDGKNLDVDFPEELPADAEGSLRIDYKVRNPSAGLHFFAPTKEEPHVPLTVWSQGEPITNRHWIPCFDRPNVRQSTELVVTVPEGFEVLSNGALLERKPNDDKTVTFHWRQEKPHPIYLVTLVVGKFDVVKEEWKGKDGKAVPVLYYVPVGRKADVARTFGRTREMLDFFSRRFGVRYPWEKYAQVVVEQFTAGGMENTSATTLTQRALHDERAILDSSPDGLIAHELAHQWWGDLLTCRDWSHIWLNEGFASFAEALWDEHARGPDAYSINMMNKGNAAKRGGRNRPIVDRRYSTPSSMFDARAYPKGAFVLHMLRERLGEATFWKGIQRYGSEHQYQSVETSDLRRTLEKVSGRDLERFFFDWTERPGHPTLEVSSAYDGETKQLRVQVKQTQAGDPFHFPLAVRVTVPGASDISTVANITSKEQSIAIPLRDRPARVEVDSAQAVLADIKETKGRDLWLEQLKNGSTAAARVRAAQYFGTSKTDADREALAQALAAEKFSGVQVEIVNALAASGGDMCRDTLVAGLKHKEPRVRRACASQLGKYRGDAKVAAALKEVLTKGDPSYFVEGAALSSYAQLGQPGTVSVLLPWLARPSHGDQLVSAALRGLGETGDAEALDTLITWTKPGKARFARMSALTSLSRLARSPKADAKQKEKALAAMTACLKEKNWLVVFGAIQGLSQMGTAAKSAQPALEEVGRDHAEERIRSAAQLAAKAVGGEGAPAGELAKLREELRKLQQDHAQLRERLAGFENNRRRGGGGRRGPQP